MNAKSYLWIGLGLALVFAMVLLVLAPRASATNDPPLSGGTVTGDWTVTNSKSYSSVSITVQDGNLNIASGGTLKLDNVQLVFYNTDPSVGNYTFRVQSGGTLTASDGGSITTASVDYLFIIEGSASIDYYTIQNMWGDNNSWKGGIQIYSDDVSITNSTIQYGYTGGISIWDCSPVIDSNIITANGQDGQSPTYCYGIYGWDTETNLSNNEIYSNQYENLYYTLTNIYRDPSDTSHYGWDWYNYNDGLWYHGYIYYYYGYLYYYQYHYYYNKAITYGTGVVIQGNSQATVYNNNIHQNGYEQPGGGSQWNYVDLGYNYVSAYSQYYGYYSTYVNMYYEDVYQYYYNYFNFGCGLAVDNSTVDVIGNTFDRNGLEPANPSYGGDSQCFYTGDAIQMVNSAGNISYNNIQNSPTLINLTGTNADINNNTLSSDFVGGQWMSGGIIPSQTVYGIRCTACTPLINDNKITMVYAEYPYLYYNNQNYAFATRAYAIDVGFLKDPFLFQGNKITIQGGDAGTTSSWFLNGSLGADATFINDNFEWKFTGGNYGYPYGKNTEIALGGRHNILVDGCTFKGAFASANPQPVPSNPNTPTTYALIISSGATLNVVNSTFSGCDWGVQGNYAVTMTVNHDTFTSCGYAIQPVFASKAEITNSKVSNSGVGVDVAYAASADIYNVTISGCDNGVQVTDFSKATIDHCAISGTKLQSVDVESRSKLTITNTPMSGNMRGVMAVMSQVLIRDCTMSHASEFILDKAATIDVFNTPHQKGAVSELDNDSFLNVSWSVGINVLWQNDVPVSGASVTIATMAGTPVYAGTMDVNGTSGNNIIWIKEYMAHNTVITKYTPHRVTASKGRAISMEFYILDHQMVITFHLVDNIPPDLVVAYPFDGQNLNYSLVTMKGTADDPESGLSNGGTIQINIDNIGWTLVSVDEFTSWSFTKHLGDGMHVVRVKAEDLAGNVARGSLQFTIDTSGPVLQVFNPKEGSYTNQRTITVTGITEENALVTINGISVQLQKRYFSNQISLEDGTNTITVISSDASGNARYVVVHVTLDTQPPLLDISSPLAGEYTNQDPVSVIGNTEPSATVMVNGVRAPLSNNTFEALVGLSEGANTLIVSATDQAGNMATRILLVYLDTAAPSLSLFTPRDELWTNQTRVLVTGATEQGASVTINGQNTNVVATVFSGYVSLLEGPNTVKVVAKDLAGNLKTETRTVYLDTTIPDLIVTTPADHIASSSHVIPVVGSVDFGTDVFVNGEQVTVTDFVFSTTVQFPLDGTQVIEIMARDRAGNTAIATRTIGVDTTTPVITLSYPQDGMRVKQRVITVSGQAEPYSTVVINTETELEVGRDGLFSVPVVLENGVNRITVTATDAAGNSATVSVNVVKPVAKAAAAEDLTWVLNLTGLLLGIGIVMPIVTFVLTSSASRRRNQVLSEVEAADQARQAREAEAARRAALPTVERIGKKKPRAPPKEEPKIAPPVLAEPPKPEATAPEMAKTGLKDKSGATEVKPDETDQATKMKAVSEPVEPRMPTAPSEPDASLKDKGGEAETKAEETELDAAQKKK